MGAAASMHLNDRARIRDVLERGKAHSVEQRGDVYNKISSKILAYGRGEDIEIDEEEVNGDSFTSTAMKWIDRTAEVSNPMIFSAIDDEIKSLEVLRESSFACLNWQNNQMAEEMLSDPALLRVSLLNISGAESRFPTSYFTGWKTQNQVSPEKKFELCFNRLLSLDISYVDGLTIDPLCFLLCPLLKRLILDGCGIESTVHKVPVENIDSNEDSEEEWAVQGSLFVGLCSLEELSLAENPLSTPSSLIGLRAVPTLRSLNLTDCPLREQSDVSTEVNKKVIELVGPNLETLDGKRMQKPGEFVQTLALQVGHIDNNDTAAGFTTGGGDLDAADKEFIQALRGEKDTTVVA